MIPLPRAGDVLFVDRCASVQFSGDQALVFRVIAVRPERDRGPPALPDEAILGVR